jgi:hypothetical protein
MIPSRTHQRQNFIIRIQDYVIIIQDRNQPYFSQFCNPDNSGIDVFIVHRQFTASITIVTDVNP